MRYKTKVTLCVGMLAGSVIAMAAVLYWGADRAQYNLDRSQRAHEEYAAYLALSAETFRLFKQIRRDLMDGEGETRFDVVLARQRLVQKLDEIESATEAERALGLREGETYEEEQRLAALKEQIGIALSEVTEVEQLLSAGARDRAIALLSSTLEHRIDRQVSAIIDAGLADEREEVAEAQEVTSELTRQLRWVALAAIIGATGFAVFAVLLLLARLRKPLADLEEGTRKIADGVFDHSIDIDGSDEFAALGCHFNGMAAQLGQQRRALEDARRNLERQVAERTVELRHANEQLSQRDEMRSRFFADISHELRTPITAMRGLAEVALRARQDRETSYRTALGRVVDVSDQLTRLVNDLFLIARSESGALDLQKAPVDLQKVASAVAEDLRPLYAEAGATLEVEAPDGPMPVAGDRERLRQVFTILIDNALKHGPKGVTTRIRLAIDGQRCRAEVIDDGEGIAAQELDKIFDRFYRGNRGKEASASNSGLGLPIAKSLVQAHRGEIRVESEVGRGTVFTICLPLLTTVDIADDGPAGEREAV